MPGSKPPAIDREIDRAGRLAWADTAKAVSILLVVLHHTVGKHLVHVVPADFAVVHTAWIELSYALKPVRMPLFFVVSGLFVGSALNRPWRDVARKRVWNIYYLYALWLTLHTAAFLVLDELAMNRTRNWPEFLANLVVASTGLWYLYALVAYFLVARLLTRVDPRIVVVIAAAVALATPALGIEEVNRVSLLQHFFYFAFAAHFPSVVNTMARVRPRPVLLMVGALAVLAVLPVALGDQAQPSRFVVSLLAVPLAVRACALLARWRPGTAMGSALGRRTMPIYVLHMPVLALAHTLLLDELRFTGTSIASIAGMVLYPLAATGFIVLACLGLHRLVGWAGFHWLFVLPFGRADTGKVPAIARPFVDAEAR